jgi:hypothetical protein
MTPPIPLDDSPFLFVRPHAPALTKDAVTVLARAARTRGQQGFNKVLNDLLGGKRSGAYCARCGLDLEFIMNCYRSVPYRLICVERSLTVAALQQQYGPLSSPF